MKPSGLCLGALLALGLVATPSLASADDSSYGPLYIQGGVGFSYWDFPNYAFGFGYSWTAFRPEVEVGYHFSGHHDGVVLGLRQAFMITGTQGHADGLTSIRGGYDIPLKVSNMELNVDPFVTLGIGYQFDGPSAGISVTGGLDAKLFIGASGLFVYARPVELGIQCAEDRGICAFNFAGSLGAGIALGK